MAEEFRVVDKEGNILGSFGYSGYQKSANPATNERVAPSAQLRLGQKGFQIILSADDANGSRIVMKDKNSTTRAVIGSTQFWLPMKKVTHKTQVASIVLFDQYARFQWSTPPIRTELGR